MTQTHERSGPPGGAEIPESMRAARFHVAERRLLVETVAVPKPGPGEVLVRVAACGICLSDVHLLDGSLPTPLPLVTPGHEAAGTIAASGEGVAGWAPGDRVVTAAGRACGRCSSCRQGRGEQCRALLVMGFSYDGAWADYVLVPATALTAVPDHVPLEQAAVLADAVATPYAGLVDRAMLRPAESVGLWGIGGLGVHAVQIARLVGAAPIVAIDPLPAARERALARGADLALDPASPDLIAEVWRATGGQGLDVSVDLVGSSAVLRQATACTGPQGRVLMVGVSMADIALGPGLAFSAPAKSLLGHFGYAPRHLEQLVGLVARGRLDVSGSISGRLALEDVAEGVRQLATKEGNPIRLVVLP